jgi:NAD-dependent DNA ligase
VSAQKICARARKEDEVREILSEIWNKPKDAQESIDGLVKKNASLFERQLETTLQKAMIRNDDRIPVS